MADPPKRHPSRPELPSIVTPDQPERAAVRHHPGVEGQPQQPPKRTTLTDLPKAQPPAPKATLSGFPAPPPALPLEYAPTKRPPLPWGKTVRAESLPEVVAAARRTDPPAAPTPPPTSARVPPEETAPQSLGKPSPLPAPSQRPEEAANAALRRRAEAAEQKATQEAEQAARLRRERDEARAAAQATVPPGSSHGLSDETIGKLVRELGGILAKKIGLPVALMAMLGGGGYAMHAASEKPAPPPLTKADLDTAIDKLRTRKGGLDDMTRAVNDLAQVSKCTRRKVTQIGESVLPAPDHMGSTRKPQPFEDDCPENPKPLPDP